jgi:hypothetical protein
VFSFFSCLICLLSQKTKLRRYQRFLGQPIFEILCLLVEERRFSAAKDDRKKPFLAPQARAQRSRA